MLTAKLRHCLRTEYKKKPEHTQQTRQKDVKLYKNSFFTFVQKVVSLLKGKLIFLLP